MCMLAAYLGPKPAAPLLLEMLRRQEAWLGGFATGIATLYQGRIYCEKSLGSVSNFEATRRLKNLPGQLGIAHSRSDGSRRVGRAHPFVDQENKFATMSNGRLGVFHDVYEAHYKKVGNKLLESGRVFASAVAGNPNPCASISGENAHGDEVIVQAVAEQFKNSGALIDSMDAVIADLPEESIRVFVTTEDPEHLYIHNFNQRLLVAIRAEEVFVSTSSFGFLDDIKWSFEVPAFSRVIVGLDGAEVQPFCSEIAYASDSSATLPLETLLINFLKSHPGATWPEVVQEVFDKEFPKELANAFLIRAYNIMEACLRQAKVTLKTEYKFIDEESGSISVARIYAD